MTLNNVIEKIPLNWALISNPINWVMIWVMIAIGIIGLKLITTSATMQEDDSNG